jgi:hypothetical protein
MDKKNLGLVVLTVFIISAAYLVFAIAGDGLIVVSPGKGSNYSANFILNCTYLNTSDVENPVGVNTTFYHNSSGVWESILNATPYVISDVAVWTNATITNITDGKFISFNCSVGNDTDIALTTNITNLTDNIRIDDTPPNVSAFSTTTAGGNYSGDTVLNVTVDDPIMGVESVYLNITNSSTTQINFTAATQQGNNYVLTIGTAGFPDGYYNVTVYANDTQLNNQNNSEYIGVTLDNTAPTVTLTSSSITSSQIVMDVGVSDATSGIGVSCGTENRPNAVPSGTGTSQTMTESSLTCGSTYSYTVACVDRAGNLGSATASFSTLTCGSSSSGGTTGGGASSSGTTYSISENQFEEGYTKQLKASDRVNLKINNQDHSVLMGSVTSTSATITVSSTPQTVTLAIGEEQKFDVTDDGFYDISVKLNKIENSKADVTVMEIYEEIPPPAPATTTPTPAAEPTAELAQEAGTSSTWIIVIVIIIIIAAIVAWYIIKKKNQ